jgi:hypothetical protein
MVSNQNWPERTGDASGAPAHAAVRARGRRHTNTVSASWTAGSSHWRSMRIPSCSSSATAVWYSGQTSSAGSPQRSVRTSAALRRDWTPGPGTGQTPRIRPATAELRRRRMMCCSAAATAVARTVTASTSVSSPAAAPGTDSAAASRFGCSGDALILAPNAHRRRTAPDERLGRVHRTLQPPPATPVMRPAATQPTTAGHRPHCRTGPTLPGSRRTDQRIRAGSVVEAE